MSLGWFAPVAYVQSSKRLQTLVVVRGYAPFQRGWACQATRRRQGAFRTLTMNNATSVAVARRPLLVPRPALHIDSRGC